MNLFYFDDSCLDSWITSEKFNISTINFSNLYWNLIGSVLLWRQLSWFMNSFNNVIEKYETGLLHIIRSLTFFNSILEVEFFPLYSSSHLISLITQRTNHDKVRIIIIFLVLVIKYYNSIQVYPRIVPILMKSCKGKFLINSFEVKYFHICRLLKSRNILFFGVSVSWYPILSLIPITFAAMCFLYIYREEGW